MTHVSNETDRAHMLLHVSGRDPVQRRAAVRTVCSLAHDAADARHLLDVLGLDPREGR